MQADATAERELMVHPADPMVPPVVPWQGKGLRECREQLLTQDAIRGSGTARHLGPTPRARLKFGRVHVCRTQTARNRRVRDARRSGTYWNRAVERRFRAQSAGCSF